MTCNYPAHEEWFHKYSQRFIRLSYPGVRRVIRRQQAVGDGHLVTNQGAPRLSATQQLPALQIERCDATVYLPFIFNGIPMLPIV